MNDLPDWLNYRSPYHGTLDPTCLKHALFIARASGLDVHPFSFDEIRLAWNCINLASQNEIEACFAVADNFNVELWSKNE